MFPQTQRGSSNNIYEESIHSHMLHLLKTHVHEVAYIFFMRRILRPCSLEIVEHMLVYTVKTVFRD